MKDKIIISIFLLFFTKSICLGQTKNIKFEWEDDKRLNIVLNGKVKTVKIKNETLINNSSDSLVYFFNAKGFPDKIINYSFGLDVFTKKIVDEEVHYTFKENKLLSKLNKLSFGTDGDIYQYDENWNLLLLKTYMSNILVKEISSKYDTKNRQIEKTEYLYGAFSKYNPITQEEKSKYLYETEKYEYNSQDKVILKLTYNYRENKTVKITQYKYDKNSNLIEEGNCLSYGEPNCEIRPLFGYEYNSKNLVTKKFQLAKFSPHNTDEYYYYDDKGNEIEAKGLYIYSDRIIPVVGYNYLSEYDVFGNKIKETEIAGNYREIGFDKYKTQITQYDKFQNMISDEYITSDDSILKIIKKKYTYDKRGNWIKMETFEGKTKDNLKLTAISKREIKYF